MSVDVTMLRLVPLLVRQEKRKKTSLGSITVRRREATKRIQHYAGPDFHFHTSMKAPAERRARARFFRADPNKINLCVNSVNYEAHKGNYRLFNRSIFPANNSRQTCNLRRKTKHDYLSQGKLIYPIGKVVLVLCKRL